jgi:hypothetical protein
MASLCRLRPSEEHRKEHLGPGVRLVGGQLQYSYPERYTGKIKMDRSLDPGEILKEWQAGTLKAPGADETTGQLQQVRYQNFACFVHESSPSII